jgi:hypothetical protein
MARCLGHDLGDIRRMPDDVRDPGEHEAHPLERPSGDDTGLFPAYRRPFGPEARSSRVDAEVERAPEGAS